MNRRADRIRVLIADDHAYTRVGLRQSLEEDGFEVCGEAATGRAAVEAARATRPDIALLDIQMPDGNGISAAYDITEGLPDTTVVMMTFSRNDDDLFAALRAGASGYLLKDMDPDRLGPSLRSILAGEVVFPRSLMTKVVETLREPPTRRKSHPQLTGRESEVAELLRVGSSTEDIAEQLSMSPTTVRVHISNLVKKLRVASRDEAVRLLNESSGARP